jgi:hypothetical protein
LVRLKRGNRAVPERLHAGRAARAIDRRDLTEHRTGFQVREQHDLAVNGVDDDAQLSLDQKEDLGGGVLIVDKLFTRIELPLSAVASDTLQRCI